MSVIVTGDFENPEPLSEDELMRLAHLRAEGKLFTSADLDDHEEIATVFVPFSAMSLEQIEQVSKLKFSLIYANVEDGVNIFGDDLVYRSCGVMDEAEASKFAAYVVKFKQPTE
jgi:hypothetical protein